MIILDTDILSLLDVETGETYDNIVAHLNLPENDEIATTIVSFEEQMRGWLAVIARARKPDELVRAYDKLHRMLRAYRRRPVMDFDHDAATIFYSLRSSIRIGTMDLRIASIALSHNALLVSRNTGDFSRIPSLRVEDWTRPL